MEKPSSASAAATSSCVDSGLQPLQEISAPLYVVQRLPESAHIARPSGTEKLFANAGYDMREAMIRQLGLETFAEMIGHFASMERGAARAWSAIVDEAWDEVGPSLERARAGLANARQVLEAANQPKAA